VHPVAFVAISNIAALVPAGASGILLVALEAPAVLPASARRIVLAAIRLGFANLAIFLQQYNLSVAVAVYRHRAATAALLSELPDIATLQNRFRSAPLGYPDHRAADLFRGQNVGRENMAEQWDQGFRQNVADAICGSLGALSV
jgi:hypothetical protein